MQIVCLITHAVNNVKLMIIPNNSNVGEEDFVKECRINYTA